MKLFNSFCLCISTVYALSLHSAVEYDIIPLQPAGYIPTAEPQDFFVRDLTESGFIVGEARDDWDYKSKGFVYHPVRGFEWIEEEEVSLIATNEQGIVVGTKEGSTLFIYDAEERKVLAELKPEFFGMYYGDFVVDRITKSGKILITFYYAERAFIVDAHKPNDPPKEVAHDIEQINDAGSMISRSKFISSTGEEMGFGSLDPYQRFPVFAALLDDQDVVAGVGYDVQDDEVGFLWDPTNGIRSFGSLGGNYMEISAMNSLLQVVGVAENQNGYDVAFLYDPYLGMQSLGTLGGKLSEALDINDQMIVVGESEYNKRLEDDTHAFIWDRDNGMRDLYTLIEKNSGWKELYRASKINNKGCIIGHGKYLGETTAFLMIPRVQ